MNATFQQIRSQESLTQRMVEEGRHSDRPLAAALPEMFPAAGRPPDRVCLLPGRAGGGSLMPGRGHAVPWQTDDSNAEQAAPRQTSGRI
jgi:hypothetical protein